MSVKMTVKQVLSFLKEFYKITSRFPTLQELEENGITRETIRQRFGTKTKAEAIAREEMASELLEAPNSHVLQGLKKRQKKYVIIGIQNNTRINQKVMSCLHRYAEKNKATILALPMYYKNPTGVIESKKLDKSYWWDNRFNGSFVTTDMRLGKYLQLMPEHRISLTSMDPLAGLEHLGGPYSAIFANPQIHFKVVPAAADRIPHILHTTGTVCVDDNYSRTNAGGKTKRFSTLGALVVELDGDVFNIRQLEYKNGCICDLGFVYTESDVKPIDQLKGRSALIWGDIHAEISDPIVTKATLKLANECNVGYHYLHDLLDFGCQSHHNDKNFLMRYMLNKNGKDKVSLSIKCVAEFLKHVLCNTDSKICIVDSNHHDHITRWLNEKDFKYMGYRNAYFYICLIKKVMEEMEMDKETQVVSGDNVLKCAIEIIGSDMDITDKVEFLHRNETHLFNGIELSQHGDVGANGSRGSIKSFSKTNVPMVIGHSHTPGIYRHIYQVGKSAYRQQSYMSGYSSHLNTHCIIYPNGGRSLITIVGGKYKI